MCNLSWTPPLLENDNSKNNPVCNTQVLSAHSIGSRTRGREEFPEVVGNIELQHRTIFIVSLTWDIEQIIT